MKNLNESSAEEPNANGAFNRSLARSIQPILVRAKTNGFERERENTRVRVFSAYLFLIFYEVRRVSKVDEGRKKKRGWFFSFFLPS